MSAKLKETALEVERAEKWMSPFDDMKANPVICVACGDELFIGDRFVWRPEGGRLIAIAHDWCAVKDGYRLTWEPSS